MKDMETSSNNNLRNHSQLQYTGAIPLPLPPKSSTFSELAHECSSELGLILLSSEPKRRHHQRTYSDSLVTDQEVVPSWLKELLDDEPAEAEADTPLCSRRSHRRSSSDSISIAYLQLQKTAEIRKEYQTTGTSSRSTSNSATPSPPTSTYVTVTPQEADHHHHHHATQISDMFDNKQINNVADPFRRCLQSNPASATRTDSKRVKRHSAQQYRARKVQYIGELERSIQVLQAEGYEVSAELEFLDQQNLILGMENRALKQQLDSLSQVQFIKCLEQEMLEREITRLRHLYQQQQHKQQQKHHGRQHRSNKRQDNLDSSFAKLSLKNNKGTESQKAR